MTLEETIYVIEEFNKSRFSENITQPNSKDLTEALNIAVRLLKQMN